MTGREKDILNEVIDNNYLNEGPKTKQLEDIIASSLEVRHAVLVPSGTLALYLALKALNIGHGDEVIVPDITFIATANAVVAAGAKVVLADVLIPTSSLCPIDVTNKITKHTKAIIPVHISGRNALTPEIRALALENSLYVVEDAAEALMSKSAEGYLGTLSDVGIYSLSPNKLITTGQGGILVTNNDEIAHRARVYKNQGRVIAGNGFRETHDMLGQNLRFTDLQAAVGLAQWEELKTRVTKQSRLAEIYAQVLKYESGIQICGFNGNIGEVPLWYDILVSCPVNFAAFMEKNGYQVRPYWHPLSHQKPYESEGPTSKNAAYISNHGVWLPSSLQLSEDEIRQAAELTCVFARDEPIEAA